MQLDRPLRVVAPTLDAEVLGVLARADNEFTVERLASLIGGRSPEGIRRCLLRLVEQGIVRHHRTGRSHAFSLNRDHLAAPAIAALASLKEELLDRVRQALRDWAEPPIFAALFGSTARGHMRVDSDIDLFLVRPDDASGRWAEQVDRLLEDVSNWTGNDARALELSASEARNRLVHEPVLADILRDGIPVHGRPSSFRQLVTQA